MVIGGAGVRGGSVRTLVEWGRRPEHAVVTTPLLLMAVTLARHQVMEIAHRLKIVTQMELLVYLTLTATLKEAVVQDGIWEDGCYIPTPLLLTTWDQIMTSLEL